jgi:undecaprenyl-diphosphatase
MGIWQAIILAIVEGITEFLPISSTGHMIIASTIMGIEDDDFVKMFQVVIQFGAILAVVVLYFKHFFQTVDFYFKLFVAFIPSAIIGLALHDTISYMLGEVAIVAVSLLAGGIVLLFIDKIFKTESSEAEKPVTYSMAIRIGLFQCIAMIPGVSRSAATIIGGMSQKLSRRQAAEFSFFLAVPTMFAASALDLKENFHLLNPDSLVPLGTGFIVAFIVAMLSIKWLITFLTRHGFRLFGYYRIALGLLILLLLAAGVELRMQ